MIAIKRHLPSLFLVLIAFCAVVILFAAEKKVQFDDFTNLLIGGIIAAIVTTLITLLLLQKQTEKEIEHDREAKVFEEKLRVYQQFLSSLRNDLEKKVSEISVDDVSNLVFELLPVYMLSKDLQTIKEVLERYADIRGVLSDNTVNVGDPKLSALSCVTDIVKVLRKDLYGEAELGTDGKLDNVILQIINKIIDDAAIEIEERPTQKESQPAIDDFKTRIRKKFELVKEDEWQANVKKPYMLYPVIRGSYIGVKYSTKHGWVDVILAAKQIRDIDTLRKIKSKIKADNDLSSYKESLDIEDSKRSTNLTRLYVRLQKVEPKSLRDDKTINDVIAILNVFDRYATQYFRNSAAEG